MEYKLSINKIISSNILFFIILFLQIMLTIIIKGVIWKIVAFASLSYITIPHIRLIYSYIYHSLSITIMIKDNEILISNNKKSQIHTLKSTDFIEQFSTDPFQYKLPWANHKYIKISNNEIIITSYIVDIELFTNICKSKFPSIIVAKLTKYIPTIK